MLPRWQLGASVLGMDGIWHDMLQISSTKQVMILARILRLHELALGRRSSKSQSCRLNVAMFEREINAIAILTHIYESMFTATTSAGVPLFPHETLALVKQKILQGLLVS